MMRIEQYVVAALMLYATAITWKCPCSKLLSCHLNEFFAATIASQVLVVGYNADKLLR
jgi:hypothetical protein